MPDVVVTRSEYDVARYLLFLRLGCAVILLSDS
jgi:hypothetical protein